MGSAHGVCVCLCLCVCADSSADIYIYIRYIFMLVRLFVCSIFWSFVRSFVHCHLSRYDFGIVWVCLGFCNTIRCLFRATSLGRDERCRTHKLMNERLRE